MKLYFHRQSGHSHRVWLFMSPIGADCELVEVDLRKDDHHRGFWLSILFTRFLCSKTPTWYPTPMQSLSIWHANTTEPIGYQDLPIWHRFNDGCQSLQERLRDVLAPRGLLRFGTRTWEVKRNPFAARTVSCGYKTSISSRWIGWRLDGQRSQSGNFHLCRPRTGGKCRSFGLPERQQLAEAR